LVKETVKRFLNHDKDFDFEYEIIKETRKIIPVWHYNQWNTGIKCNIKVKSHPKILQLI